MVELCAADGSVVINDSGMATDCQILAKSSTLNTENESGYNRSITTAEPTTVRNDSDDDLIYKL